MADGGAIREVDGSSDFAGGVDSGRVTTLQGPLDPTGIHRDQLVWASNATMRGGGVGQRTGWQPRVASASWSGKFQCAFMYKPEFGDPYMILSVGGRIYLMNVDGGLTDLSAIFGLTNPADLDLGHMCQAETYLIIQAGDFTTLPLFWDGTNLTRSNGIINPAGDPNNQIPAAGAMEYFMGRLWYAFGRTYAAGDIVGGTNGIASVLYVTENPIALGGDGFTVPSVAGDIRALKYSGNQNTQLGSTTQGTLYIFTREQIYSCDVPVTRAQWTALEEPFQRVIQMNYGAVSDRCIVRVNGDLFYQSVDGVRALKVALRDVAQWGDTPISRNEQRAIRFNDRTLLRWATGINFDNRLLQSCLPKITDLGVAHDGVLPLDFDLISSLGSKLPPAWEGIWDGLDILQLLEADFGGRQRAFAMVHSRITGDLQMWELTVSDRFENGDNRVTWFVETPSYTWGDTMSRKQLDGMELWIDKLFGTVDFSVYYIPDQHPCPVFWKNWQDCAARNCEEDATQATCTSYPAQPYREQFRNYVLPTPPAECLAGVTRPSNVGFQFRVIIQITGWCRIRGLRLYALPKPLAPFEQMVCNLPETVT